MRVPLCAPSPWRLGSSSIKARAGLGRGAKEDIVTRDRQSPPVPPPPPQRWRKVLPGEESQIRVLRGWLAGLLPECTARDDVIAVAVELATNAVQHTASGRGGWFAVEITWHPTAVRVAVADQGSPTGPQVIDDPTGERGRGLQVVGALSARTGVAGGQQGRLVWADVPWISEDAAEPAGYLDSYEAAIRDGHNLLAHRHAAVPAWFGRSTLQWWALAGRPGAQRLVTAATPQELSRLLDTVQALDTVGCVSAAASSVPNLGSARVSRRSRQRVPRLAWTM